VPKLSQTIFEYVKNVFADFLVHVIVSSQMEIWGLEDGWKEIGKVHELFCKRVMGMPNMATDGACVKVLGRTNRKEKVMERVLRYWQRL
jgi:hypothetical protein